MQVNTPALLGIASLPVAAGIIYKLQEKGVDMNCVSVGSHNADKSVTLLKKILGYNLTHMYMSRENVCILVESHVAKAKTIFAECGADYAYELLLNDGEVASIISKGENKVA